MLFRVACAQPRKRLPRSPSRRILLRGFERRFCAIGIAQQRSRLLHFTAARLRSRKPAPEQSKLGKCAGEAARVQLAEIQIRAAPGAPLSRAAHPAATDARRRRLQALR